MQDAKEQAGIVLEAQSLLEKLQVGLDQWETRKLLNGSYDDRCAQEATAKVYCLPRM